MLIERSVRSQCFATSRAKRTANHQLARYATDIAWMSQLHQYPDHPTPDQHPTHVAWIILQALQPTHPCMVRVLCSIPWPPCLTCLPLPRCIFARRISAASTSKRVCDGLATASHPAHQASAGCCRRHRATCILHAGLFGGDKCPAEPFNMGKRRIQLQF